MSAVDEKEAPPKTGGAVVFLEVNGLSACFQGHEEQAVGMILRHAFCLLITLRTHIQGAVLVADSVRWPSVNRICPLAVETPPEIETDSSHRHHALNRDPRLDRYGLQSAAVLRREIGRELHY